VSHAAVKTNPGPGFTTHPDHAITINLSNQRVRVMLGGEAIADSTQAIVLNEGDYDPTYYFPRRDVRMELMSRTDHKTHCPFKHDASYWTIRAGDKQAVNAAWSYETPYDEVVDIKDYIAFYPDRIDSIEQGVM